MGKEQSSLGYLSTLCFYAYSFTGYHPVSYTASLIFIFSAHIFFMYLATSLKNVQRASLVGARATAEMRSI